MHLGAVLVQVNVKHCLAYTVKLRFKKLTSKVRSGFYFKFTQ